MVEGDNLEVDSQAALNKAWEDTGTDTLVEEDSILDTAADTAADKAADTA